MTKSSVFSAGTFVLAAILAAALAGCVVSPPYNPQPAAQLPPADEGVVEQASEPPPPLPVYEQPPCPEDGYIWTPGLWRWGPEGYYWVPGTWVAPPQVGMLWTPGFWALAGAVYVFHAGHWGNHVGYYGGINYGGGYGGSGYGGGRWVNNRFQYNTAVSNVNTTIVHNTYIDKTVINNVTINRTSYSNTTVNNTNIKNTNITNNTVLTKAETGAAAEPHYAPTAPQTQHQVAARANPGQNAARNEGRPPVAATPRPGAFEAREVTAAKPVGPAYHPQHAAGSQEKSRDDERH
jgi:WXXGXW repeat (2 copies)